MTETTEIAAVADAVAEKAAEKAAGRAAYHASEASRYLSGAFWAEGSFRRRFLIEQARKELQEAISYIADIKTD